MLCCLFGVFVWMVSLHSLMFRGITCCFVWGFVVLCLWFDVVLVWCVIGFDVLLFCGFMCLCYWFLGLI